MRFDIAKRRVGVRLSGLVILCVLVACQPSDRRPGLWLSGETVASLPSSWAFTNEHREIYVQVKTPYFIPHSVTIWCAEVAGQLFIGARNPETKNWPGWVDKNPEVVLKIDDGLYAVAMQPVSNTEEIDQIKMAYATKYQLKTTAGSTPPPMRYWHVIPR
ncbi:MAG: hypothetical protein AAF387_08905 [Pseudomonadota bacterium]